VEEKYDFSIHIHDLDRELPPLPLSLHPQTLETNTQTPFTTRALSSLFYRTTLSPLIHTLKPSFLHQPLPTHNSRPPRALHSASYLDGLRGVAALIVFIDHFTIHCFENMKFGYGSSPENNHSIQLPILKLVYSGRASVGVFFVVIGFVLSYKPLH
jgi:hypothetical protein